jgi:hypothetical protein
VDTLATLTAAAHKSLGSAVPAPSTQRVAGIMEQAHTTKREAHCTRPSKHGPVSCSPPARCAACCFEFKVIS